MFPNERIVLEIPIYSMSEKEFNRRWDKRKKYLTEYFMESGKNSEERAKEFIFTGYYPQYVWKYNQIVGFVEIAVAPRDILFNVCKTLDKKMVAVSKTKHFIQNLCSGSKHFPIEKKTNEEIVREIDSWLESIGKELPKTMCLFLDTYNIVKYHMDFIGIRNDIIKAAE